MKQKKTRNIRERTPHAHTLTKIAVAFCTYNFSTLDWTTLIMTVLDRNTPNYTSMQTHRAEAMLHRGADGCHGNMPGRLQDWIITSRMGGRSRGGGGGRWCLGKRKLSSFISNHSSKFQKKRDIFSWGMTKSTKSLLFALWRMSDDIIKPPQKQSWYIIQHKMLWTEKISSFTPC